MRVLNSCAGSSPCVLVHAPLPIQVIHEAVPLPYLGGAGAAVAVADTDVNWREEVVLAFGVGMVMLTPSVHPLAEVATTEMSV